MKKQKTLFFPDNTFSKTFRPILSEDYIESISKNKDTNKFLISKINTKKNDQKFNTKYTPKTFNMKKSLSFTYRFFDIESKNKKKSLFDKSLGIKTIRENNNMNSNFETLSKEANKYTSNAEYIKNKRIQIFELKDKTQTANSERNNSKNTYNRILYKTTYFRGGKFINDKEKRKKKIIKRIDRNMSIEEIVDYLEQNKDNLNIFKKEPKNPKKKKIIIDDNYQEKKTTKIYSNLLYKEIMNKKEEIISSIINNKINEYQEISNQNSNTPFNNSALYFHQENNSENNINYNNSNNSESKINNTSLKHQYYYTNLFSKKETNGVPLVFPKILSSTFNYKSKGQNSRYEYILENFLKIKTLIEGDKKYGKNNEYEYIKEFLISKNIDIKYINKDSVINFSKFLKQKKFPIDINKSLKDNILSALNYNEENEKNNCLSDNSDNIITKINPKHLIKKKSRNKVIRRDELNSDMFIWTRRKFDYKKNYKSLLIDLFKQKKLYRKEEERTDIKLKEELKNEINKVEDEINNKQDKIKQIENKMKLIPFSSNYYSNKRLENQNNKQENPIELRLMSLQEMRNNLLSNFKEIKKTNLKQDLFNLNERLYYNWFRDKTKRDINKFTRRTKLTELVVYNKTKERLLKDQLKDEFYGKKVNDF